MRIIDTTTFFEEHLMMDIRFNILDPFVDKFIVCESLYTHSGEKKKLILMLIIILNLNLKLFI